jgi:hypothetical protein
MPDDDGINGNKHAVRTILNIAFFRTGEGVDIV